MKKGFTLVELLAVIAILGLLIGIAVPSTLAIANRSKKNLYCTKIEIIEKDAIRWGQNHTDELASAGNEISDLTIKNLLDEGYIKADNDKGITDPRDNLSINDTAIKVYIKNNRVYAEIAKTKNSNNEETIVIDVCS